MTGRATDASPRRMSARRGLVVVGLLAVILLGEISWLTTPTWQLVAEFCGPAGIGGWFDGLFGLIGRSR